MDYASITPPAALLAATGLGLFDGPLGQLWLLAVPVLILAGTVLLVRARFRRGRGPEDL